MLRRPTRVFTYPAQGLIELKPWKSATGNRDVVPYHMGGNPSHINYEVPYVYYETSDGSLDGVPIVHRPCFGSVHASNATETGHHNSRGAVRRQGYHRGSRGGNGSGRRRLERPESCADNGKWMG
jgi:hypothetical protein